MLFSSLAISAERWLESSQSDNGLHIHSLSFSLSLSHTHTFLQPQSRERRREKETHQVIKALALPWKLKEWPFALLCLCLSPSLPAGLIAVWLLSTPEYFTLPGSQPIVHCASDYPTVGNCGGCSPNVISPTLHSQSSLLPRERGGCTF